MGGMTIYGEVLRVERLTPRLVRVVLGGDGLAGYEPTEWTDEYVNALFLPPGALSEVPFDLDAARAGDPAQRPMGRRYTIRSWDAAARELAIDFVVHGDVGLAGRWANHAEPGDRLQFTGPSGGYRPDPTADWHLLVGDESALPAIARSLEEIPGGHPAVVVAVVDDAAHELPLTSPGELRTVWVHRHPDAAEDALLRAVEAFEFLAGRVDVFVHGEAAEVRAVRRFLLADRGVAKEASSISPYWRRDHTDEDWRKIKGQWLADSEADV